MVQGGKGQATNEKPSGGVLPVVEGYPRYKLKVQNSEHRMSYLFYLDTAILNVHRYTEHLTILIFIRYKSDLNGFK